MNYELAKELMEAGFPKSLTHKIGVNYVLKKGEEYYIPLLSELIEACGGVEFRLHCYPKNFGGDIVGEPWFVIERPNWKDLSRYSTPEEAVAHLWLALKQSENNSRTA